MSSTTLFGTSLNGGSNSSLQQEQKKFGPIPIVRAFNTGLPASWASRPALAGRSSVVSFKVAPQTILSGADDAKLRAWFQSAPKAQNVYWSYYHEPENDVAKGKFTAAQYRAAWQHVANLAKKVDNPCLHATLILMGWTQSPKSGRKFSDYYPGSQYIDVLGWDVYNYGHRKNSYVPAAQLYNPVKKFSASVGKPWGIAETASIKLASDPTGAGRAAWLKASVAWLRANGAKWDLYFDTVGGRGTNYLLSDKPSISAWKSAVGSS